MAAKRGPVFMTGGFGFIGSALLPRLLEQGPVTVFDNGARRSPQFERLRDHSRLTVVDGDILDAEAVAKAMRGATAVIHLAAIAGVTNYYKMPLRTMEVNLLGTRNVLEAARREGKSIQRFVNFCTSEIYGPMAWRVHEVSPTQQGDVAEPRWVYAISKLAAEKMAFSYHVQHGLPVSSLRPFNIYGPGQVGEGAIQVFIKRALAHEPIEVTGDGAQVRSWCYIDDMCDATIQALQRPAAVGRAYNIGDPRSTVTILALAQRVRELAASRSEIRFVPHQGTDVQVRVPEIERARKELGFEPRVGLDEGLKRAIEWYRATGTRGEDPRATARAA